MLQQQQNLGRIFGSGKMHLPPPPVALAAVRSRSTLYGSGSSRPEVKSALGQVGPGSTRPGVDSIVTFEK